MNKGLVETEAEKVARSPNVLRAYATEIAKDRIPDSDAAWQIEKAAERIEFARRLLLDIRDANCQHGLFLDAELCRRIVYFVGERH